MSAIVCGTISSTLGGMFVSARLTTGMPHCSASASVTCASVTSPMRIATCPMISPGTLLLLFEHVPELVLGEIPEVDQDLSQTSLCHAPCTPTTGSVVSRTSVRRGERNPRLDLRFDDRRELTGISVNSTAATPKPGPTGFRRASTRSRSSFATLSFATRYWDRALNLHPLQPLHLLRRHRQRARASHVPTAPSVRPDGWTSSRCPALRPGRFSRG